MAYTPYTIHGADRTGPWLITCDHASNVVPSFVNNGSLGLPACEMERHIAYDVGAQGVSLALGQALDATVICSDYSRLVIDPNRGEEDPTLIMQLYDGTIIPGNRQVDAAEKQRRIDLLYRPYHTALAELAARPGIVILSIHSFTRQLNGRPPRPWEVGVLSAEDRRFTNPLMTRLRMSLSTPVGDNEPYGGHLPGDAIDKHAIAHGRPNALIELRNDLIRDAKSQLHWARFLAPHLEAARADANL